MGIGRRTFVKTFSAALVSLAAAPARAAGIFDDCYVNRELGVAFRKPPGWLFSDVREWAEIKKGEILCQKNPNHSEAWTPSDTPPILTIAPEPITARCKTFAPGINFFAESLGLPARGTSRGVEIEWPMKITADALKAHRRSYRDWRLTVPLAKCRVSNCDAADYTATFLFEHKRLAKPVPVRMWTLCIWQKPTFYTVRMFDAAEAGDTHRFDYRPFVESIRIV